jgi:hypothetical protein
MILVSFYADPPGTRYFSKAGNRLIQTCVDRGIRHHIERLDSGPTWLSNTAKKPFFVRDMLRRFSPILWVDVDSHIGGDPLPVAEAALKGYDVAVTGFRNQKARGWQPKAPLPADPLATPLRIMGIAHAWSGSLASWRLVDRWCELAQTERADLHGDHRLQQYALDELTIAGEITYTYFPESIGRGPLVRLVESSGVPGRKEAMTRAMRMKRQAARKK